MTRQLASLRTITQTARAFYMVGARDALAYPLAFALTIGSRMTNVFLYFFMAKIVSSDNELMGVDYFAYAVIGTLVLWILGAGLEEFGNFVQRTINQGTLELYLVQPIGWRVLPFVWFQWLLVERLIAGGVTVLIAIVLGMRFQLERVGLALVVLLLGVAATHAIGVIAASVRILAKRADPVLLAYTVATTVFSGLFVPVQVLPGPLQAASWLTPHTYAVDALRQLLIEGGDEGARISVGGAILALAVFSVVAYAVGLALFNGSLNYARRRGILGSY